MIPPLFKNSWRGMSGVLDLPPVIPPQHDSFTLAPGSLGSLTGQEYSLTVGQLTPALNLVYAALGHTHGIGDIIGLGSAAAANVGDFAAAAHTHVLADVTDAGTAAAANVGDFAAASHTHVLADVTDAGTAAAANVGDFAAAIHTHVLADVTDAGTAAAANVGDFAAAAHTHGAADITSGTLDTARLGSGTANATTYLRGDQTWASITAGIGGSTGATDNLALRADGAGGATLQNSALRIDDVTASTQQNLTLANADAATNSALVLSPKGTGSFIVGQKPNGSATGGNARGIVAIDIQTRRNVASQVASGEEAIVIGHFSTANNVASMAIGNSCSVSGYLARAIGYANTASGDGSLALNNRATVTHAFSVVVGACHYSSDAVSSDRTEQFKVRADNGITHQTDGGTYTDYGKRASAPGSPVAGDRYYDTATNKLRVYNGTIWNDCW